MVSNPYDMTLDQYIGRLRADHLAREQYEELKANATPPACVVTEGEIAEIAGDAWGELRNPKWTTVMIIDRIRAAIRSGLTRAGGRVVSRNTIAGSIANARDEWARRESEGPVLHDYDLYLADAILTAIAGEGET